MLTRRKSFHAVKGRPPRPCLRRVHAPEGIEVATERDESALPSLDLEAGDRRPLVALRVEHLGRVQPLAPVAAADDVDEAVQRFDGVRRSKTKWFKRNTISSYYTREISSY